METVYQRRPADFSGVRPQIKEQWAAILCFPDAI
jgi:hypothetical protein